MRAAAAVLALLLAAACTGDDPVTARRKQEEKQQEKLEQARQEARTRAEALQRDIEGVSDQLRTALQAMDAAKDDGERSVLRTKIDELKAKLRDLKIKARGDLP